MGTIQRKTGEGREAIEKVDLNELTGPEVQAWDRRQSRSPIHATSRRRHAKHHAAGRRSGSGRLWGSRALCPRPAGGVRRAAPLGGLGVEPQVFEPAAVGREVCPSEGGVGARAEIGEGNGGSRRFRHPRKGPSKHEHPEGGAR